MYENNEGYEMGMLVEAMTKGGKTRNSKKYTNIYDPNYISMVEKSISFSIYSTKLMELMLSAFKWTGFPDTVNVRHLEKTLHYSGSAVIAEYNNLKDPRSDNSLKSGDLCSFRLGASRGRLDIYGDPLIYQVHGHDYQDDVSIDSAVIIYNNRLRSSTSRVINHIAFKLAEADLIISQNLKVQSVPIIITGNEEQKKDVMAVYQAVSNFVPIVVGSKSLGNDVEIKAQTTIVPLIVDKINTHKHTLWNEGMTFLGIDNANQEKRERMITGEVNANDGQINLFRESMILEREEAVAKINKMFGLEVKVEYNNGPMDELAEMFAQAQYYEKLSEVDLNLAEAEEARNNSEEVL